MYTVTVTRRRVNLSDSFVMQIDSNNKFVLSPPPCSLPSSSNREFNDANYGKVKFVPSSSSLVSSSSASLDSSSDESSIRFINKIKSKKRKRPTSSSSTKPSYLPNGLDGLTNIPNPHSPSVVPDKYWVQRSRFFSKFDTPPGVQLDPQSWYSVTPEAIANYHSGRIAALSKSSSKSSSKTSKSKLVVLDAFCGVGGDTISLALQEDVGLVVAVDTDYSRLKMAESNARLYGVEEGKILFVLGDSLEVMGILGGQIINTTKATTKATASPVVSQTMKFLRQALSDRAESHGVNHAIAVYENSMKIYDMMETTTPTATTSRDIVAIAALLHDVLDHKYSQTASASSSTVEQFLTSTISLPPKDVAAINSIIKNVSFSREKKGLMDADLNEGVRAMRDIVSDADKIEAIGIEGLRRCYDYQVEMANANANANADENTCLFRDVYEHCDEKLVRLLPDYFRTDAGKRLGRDGHEFLVRWMEMNKLRFEESESTDISPIIGLESFSQPAGSVDVVFLSPPWGGVDYNSVGKNGFDITKHIMVRSDGAEVKVGGGGGGGGGDDEGEDKESSTSSFTHGGDLLKLASTVSSKIMYFLPKNVNETILGEVVQQSIKENGAFEITQEWLNDKHKATIASFNL